jgi:hypothetical protein
MSIIIDLQIPHLQANSIGLKLGADLKGTYTAVSFLL